jgi:hypothetical protein
MGVTISASLLPPAVNSGIVVAAHFFAAQKNLPQLQAMAVCIRFNDVFDNLQAI